MHKLLFFVLFFSAYAASAQTDDSPKLFRFTSSFTAFPDTARAKGHTYNKIFYPAEKHYSDSTVLIAVPARFKAGKQIDVIVWFHGWYNTIDSAAAYFELLKQFAASKRNAILVIPEMATRAPDSYGGKLERQEIFKHLLHDVLLKLKTEKIIGKGTKPGNILLAGHSGAFRVMAHILQNGAVEVKQIILFDGLYSQLNKYINWIQAGTVHRFINLYTNKGGGTDEVSEMMMQQLSQKHIPYVKTEEKDLQPAMLKNNRVIFIHSLKEHNDVINRPDHNFRLFTENSDFLKPVPD
jgi:hypothetical protein